MTSSPLLVVDLDGTLLRSDMLFETFWSGLASDWRLPVRALCALRDGRAALKRALTERAHVDATTLPYNDRVIAFISDWRARGGRTALVTASDQRLADAIAAHVGLFDEVHGSEPGRNLKGRHKAAFLVERYGAGGYSYMGDAPADLPVWAQAERAITVDAPAALRARVARLNVPAEHLETRTTGLKAHLRALRPHQWMKNLLIFVPMFTAHALTLASFTASLIAFLSFSLIASSVYVLNDLLDLGADRAHPRKRNRPFASGAIPIAHGTWMAPALFLGGLAAAATLGGRFVLVMLGYYVVTTAYSLWLKRKLVIDICTLAGLYTIRIVAGAAAVGLPLSVWLLAFSIFFFFSLAAVKRQAELVDGVASGKVKAHGRGYVVSDLPLVANMAIASGYVSVLVMALYLNSPAVLTLYKSPSILWGICLVLLFWISRIVMITHRGGMHDDPVVFAAKDRISLISFLAIFALAVAGAVL